ncbi:hypothetical protein [Vibrio algarum]|uniref:Uncharacterized protein n=1 Tax=Vibrio algarum TaxID=3020714 RepID=A0ABT4YQW2_9VIBR|nr:hypothetical protein [Vibrio sp. KJ40-1]MDB1123942.1 hypothetical protein [Vibrio sp. KJ40-1]
MFNTEGNCDWCNRHRLLIRHDYIDGKYNHSCESCNDLAKIDVRLFNTDEIALRNKMAESLHS